MTAKDAAGEPGAVKDVVERVNRTLDKVDGMTLPTGNRSSAKIEVNAGGVGVWIAVTCCLVMMGVMVVGSAFVVQEFGRQSDQLRELRDKDDAHDAWIQVLNNNKQDKERK